jgi:hypothetical protein
VRSGRSRSVINRRLLIGPDWPARIDGGVADIPPPAAAGAGGGSGNGRVAAVVVVVGGVLIAGSETSNIRRMDTPRRRGFAGLVTARGSPSRGHLVIRRIDVTTSIRRVVPPT